VDPPATDPPAVDPPAVDPPAVDPPSGRLEQALEVVGKNLKASPRGLVPVALRCASTVSGGCKGVMRLEELPSKSTKSLTAARRRKVVGRVRYKLEPGKSKKVNIRLDRRSFRKYKKRSRVRLRLVIEQTGADGTTAKTVQTVSLSTKK
jgi:hypothetical protein